VCLCVCVCVSTLQSTDLGCPVSVLCFSALDADAMQGKCVGGNAEKTRLIAAARTCYAMLFENICYKSRCEKTVAAQHC
jgi:hypothetical protein